MVPKQRWDSVAAAAGREICVRAGGESEQRRDQREAEEEKKDDAEGSSHWFLLYLRDCGAGMDWAGA